MVEMIETAGILNQATSNSLVILDEIGRGTATFDGLSIAWASVEHLHEINKSRALFATHYHELTSLKSKLNNLKMYNLKVKEWEGEIIFLHTVEAGTADKSYGILVAKLAGIPKIVISRAKVVLESFEKKERNSKSILVDQELPLFSEINYDDDSHHNSYDEVINFLKDIQPDDYTPREAMEKLYELKSLIKDKKIKKT